MKTGESGERGGAGEPACTAGHAGLGVHAGSGGVWRAIDAAANRAAEAVRVVEDVVRFVLDDLELTRVAKDLRHALATQLAAAGLRSRAAMRDVQGDVGAGLEPSATLRRASAADLVAANAARAGQALRTLQECAAVVAPEAVAGFEQLRYRLYGLERRALAATRARERLAGVNLCVLVDGRQDMPAFVRLIESLLDAGVRMLQIRDKHLPTPALAARAARAVAVVRQRGGDDPAIVIVNDRADVAVATGSAGVHTGEDDLPIALVRRVVGPDLLVGRTAHTLAEARAAVTEAADYLGVGPCFPSATKAFGTCASPDFLRAVADEVRLPVFAIGGISLESLDELVPLGISRVAVASAVTAAADPAAAAAALIARLRTLTSR